MAAAVFNFFTIVIVFSSLIIVHELGHFFAARFSGVKVTDFAIGFGPPLFKKKIKETNFLICLIPLGGYIKMAGDSRNGSRGYKDEFFSKPVGVRARIVLAGPLFNYILAFAVFLIIASVGFYVQDTVVGAVKSGSPAEAAGIREGDRVVSVNKKNVDSWFELEDRIQASRKQVEIVLLRENREIELKLNTEKVEGTDRLGRKAEVAGIGILAHGPVIGGVVEGYPAEAAGLKAGDRILEINRKQVRKWPDIPEAIKSSQESVLLKIERNKEIFSLEVPVKRDKQIGPDGQERKTSLIGITPQFSEKFLQKSFPQSLLKASGMLFETTLLSLQSIWYMITDPAISFKDSVGGPIYISYMISKTAQLGIIALLQLVALLSVFLFIINLVPIPVFDGGHILFFAIEKIRSKPLSQKVEETATKIGFALIIVLMFFVFYNDIVRRGPDIWRDVKKTFRQK